MRIDKLTIAELAVVTQASELKDVKEAVRSMPPGLARTKKVREVLEDVLGKDIENLPKHTGLILGERSPIMALVAATIEYLEEVS